MESETRDTALNDLFEFAANLARLANGGVHITVHGVPFAEFKSDSFDKIAVRDTGDDSHPYLAATHEFGTARFTVSAFSPDIASTERGQELLADTTDEQPVALRQVS